ncbi:hypothetical protein ABT112_33270 [Streptomyces sp. NPDC002055]|uniref:hypothetical protein n=1 Tax=Streptomyces sp. NPDC002055 TaxID=3154534 RepID=UPI00333043F6
MSTVWRRVLTALVDEDCDEEEREHTLALGAAHLAVTRAVDGPRPTPEDVMHIAFWEFALLLDAGTARSALRDAQGGVTRPAAPR